MEGWRRTSPALRKKTPTNAVQGGSRGGIRHKRGPGERLLDPSCELEVLKCIMVREGYLARITRLVEDMTRRAKRSHGQLQALPPGMVDLLDLLRIATLETVEAISLWRLSQVTPTPAPFEWNGHNYLMKMLQDCNFIDRVEALRSWLGFQVSGNPFLLPQQSCVDTDPDSGLTSQTTTSPDFAFDKIGLTDVGRQPWLGPLQFDVMAGSEDSGRNTGARSKKRRLRKTGAVSSLAPYAAAVVNDPTLLPAVKAPGPARLSSPDPFGLKNGLRLDAPPGTAVVNIEGLVPNLVSREDTQRIRVARQALLEEQTRVRQAEEASQEADEGGGGRQRSRAPSTVSGAAPPSTSVAAGKYSRAFTSSSYSSPTKRRTSHFGPQSTRRTGSSAGTHSLNPRAASTSRGSGDMRSIVLTTAGLLHRPPAEPHQGLGPVLLQSDRPGGELRPNPFLHTVSDAHSAKTEDLEPGITIRTPKTADTRNVDRCSTAPLAPSSSTSGPLRDSNTRKDARRPSVNHRRASTAPAKVSGASSARSLSFSGQAVPSALIPGQVKPTPRVSCPGGTTIKEEEREQPDSGYSPRGQRLSRKAGAELWALTAAGTAGRRQPPPRETRLRRLARDVARHSAELRRLVREEKHLRKGLACCSGGDGRSGEVEVPGELQEHELGAEAAEDSDAVAMMVSIRYDDGAGWRVSFSDEKTTSGGPAKRMGALLEGKRREIELKAFDLGLKRDELHCLRLVQKQERERQLALEMERRRAHLDVGQRLPEDDKVAETLEDSSCLLLQKRVRGNVGRAYVAWYKGNIQQAATTIQRGVRFIWDRRATRRRLLLNASVRPMQAAIRMFVKRQRYKRLLRQRRELLATCKLQVVSRGMLGRRRAAARRSMIAAATRALDWVSLERLQPGHLKELARAIHGALVDPVRQFPPAGVLGALRVALTILDDGGASASETTNAKGVDIVAFGCGGSDNGKDTVTFETALGRTVRSAVSAPDLTWEMAARVLERPFRLLRRMRAFASGLGASSDSTPARLLHLSPRAAELLSAYRSDPSWSFEAMSAITEGGVASKAFVGWAIELERVYREQPRVEAFLRDAQPAWLRKGRSFQRRRRALELHAEACRRAVSVAREYRRHLETRGLAYGDPVMATEVLENQLDEAEEAARQLETRRSAFLAAQAKVEEDAGRALREDVEFAEREASVAAREEEMALRLRQSGHEELEALAGRVRDCGVVVRELQRRLRVWEQRCREEKRPLLDEWVPPTEGQARMSRALGEGRAWQQTAVVRKARLVENAGGRRFVKGLSGKDLEAWRSVVESLAACGADIESGEPRLAEDVDRFERELARANAEIAAEKVRSAPWDNATEDTQALEHQEDADAARDERRTSMGATLPPGMLEISSSSSSRRGAEGGGGQPFPGGSGSSSRRPTLLLLGLDLPASVRDGIRAGLDRGAPGLFGGHVVGADALPSLASAAQTAAAGRTFFARCPELGTRATAPPPSSDGEAWLTSGGAKEGAPVPAPATAAPERGEQGRDEPSNPEQVTEGASEQQGKPNAAAKTRAELVQAALSEGKNVSVEVVPGPGLWARGRFLRDLEALLGGLDDCGCGGEEPDDTSTGGRGRKRSGPTVLLVDGHNRNRSGGGTDLTYGTKLTGKAAPRRECAENPSKPESARSASHETLWALPAASLAARRAKALMEEAAQCLHDLSTTYGKTLSPFKALQAAKYASLTPSASLREEDEEPDEPATRLEKAEAPTMAKPSPARGTARCEPNPSLAAEGSPGMELLLAACHMILHPDGRYDVGECQEVGSMRTAAVRRNDSETCAAELNSDAEAENAAKLVVNTSRLAGACRKELAEKSSARDVAEVLRGAALEAIPLETAVALRRLVRHPDWPTASPRPDLAECCASEAFTGWIYAAVAGATELALEAGGGALEVCFSGREGGDRNETRMSGWIEDRGLCGDAPETRSAMKCEGKDALLSLKVARAERWREQEVLREMEAALVDENVTVLDDDSPWLALEPPEKSSNDVSRVVQDRRQCRTSEVLNALVETALRSFNVFEEPDCRIPASSRSPQPSETAFSRPPGKQPTEEDRFCVTVSRVFGSVYARAVSFGTGGMRRGQAVMTRAREEDLIPLLSSNWMEKHDLSALRELRTEPAVWRALVNTLVLRYPSETAPGRATEASHAQHQAKTEHAATKNAVAVTTSQDDELAAPDASPSKQEDGRGDRVSIGDMSGAAGVLSFRHERRLTLVTSCLLMGRAVPVSVFEESRSDFWCEAEVPAALTATGSTACPVGMRVPKECIPLILDDDHPMRMRTILDASDLRHLSVLIADRLKLCRVGSTRKGGGRSYHYWLDGAIGGKGQPQTEGSKASAGAGAADAGFADATQRDEDEDEPGREFKLSLRKRSIGQVVFSRLVSLWVPSFSVPEANKSHPSEGHVAQRLVVMKEFSHRGECGELRGEVHDPDSGGEMETFVPAPELTRMLLGNWLAEMKTNERSKNPCARYWRDALTWRLRITSEPALYCGGIDGGRVDETDSLSGMERTAPSPLTSRDGWVSRLTVDERKPLFTLRRVAAASLETSSSAGAGKGSDGPLAGSNMYFDVMLLLPRPEEPGSSRNPTRRPSPTVELVATHRQTMTAFSFSVSVTVLVEELDAVVAACLTAPTALLAELELSASCSVLRDLTGKWLKYSPGYAQGGRGPTLTLNFPRTRTKPVVAEPYVSLRCSGGKKKTINGGRKRHAEEANDAVIAAAGGASIPVEGCAPDSRQGTRATQGHRTPPSSRPRSIREKSIATLQVETRNERMVFRRSLAVPQVGDLGGPGPVEGGPKELGPKELAVSVYETFTPGSTGRIERHARFCTRDESVRPVVEAATTVPWVGTCEGIEGGKLWRVVTQGLSVECARSKMGKCVGMRLEVATTEDKSEERSEERAVSRHATAEPGRRKHAPPATAAPLSPDREGEEDECIEREPKAAEAGKQHDNDDSSAKTKNSDEKVEQEERSVVKRRQTPPGRAGLVGKTGDLNDNDRRPRRPQEDAEAADAVGPHQEQRGNRVSPLPADGARRHAPDPPKGRGETGSAFRRAGVCTDDEITRVYSGWHRVTGIRLHVQCFQGSNGNAVDLADIAAGSTPAGRGGGIGLPRDASLQFLVCDPSTGQRTGVKVSVDEIRKNLSVDGGIVEAGLLDAGRRPALAKAVAEKLRLVFEAGGGYRVVLPLPAKWRYSGACQQAG